jgi:hypothetical protein
MGDSEEMAMKILGITAMSAALVATTLVAAAFGAASASAQAGGSATAEASQRETVTDRSEARNPTKSKRSIARLHGGGSFASAEAAGSRAARGRAAVSAFDGEWSVLILTRSGACDPSYRYGVAISNGEVVNAGGAPVDLEGHVAPNGAVRVSVSAGNQEAHGAGRLSRTSGGGTWRGSGSVGICAGTWEAERRE